MSAPSPNGREPTAAAESKPPVVSVVIPVYNVAPYLAEAIESLRRQTFAEFEGILIDDGSNDGSSELCDRLAAADSRLRVAHRPNGGVASARNAGLDLARGEYIYFLDADDAIRPETLSLLLKYALKYPRHIVGADYREVRNAPLLSHLGEMPDSLVPTEATPVEAVTDILYQRQNHCSLWGKLFPADLWQGLRFPQGILYEDLDLFYRLYARAGGSIYLDVPVVAYRIRPGSILRHYDSRRTDVLDVTDRLVEWIADPANGMTGALAAATARRLSAHINMLGLMHAFRFRNPAMERRCRRVIKESCRSVMTDADARRDLRLLAQIAALLGGRLPAPLLGIAYRLKG